MGQPELARDPRFTDNEARMNHMDELVDTIEAWLRSQPSDDAPRPLPP